MIRSSNNPLIHIEIDGNNRFIIGMTNILYKELEKICKKHNFVLNSVYLTWHEKKKGKK